MICGSCFSGIGLLDYGLHLAGFEHRWLCESDEWRRGILRKRFPEAVVHADVRDAHAGWGRVDLVAGGFPCKGASTAGKREGFGHPETVLWREMARAVRELRPRYVLVENVANILGLHDGAVWGEVLGDLAALGFDVVWDCLPAAAVGAAHRRDRVFAVATYAGEGGLGQGERPLHAREPDAEGCGEVSTAHTTQLGSERGGRTRPGRDGSAHGGAVALNAEGEREQARPAAREELGRAASGPVATAAHSGGRGLPQQPAEHSADPRTDEGRRHALGRGVPVEWGGYGSAIRRWEAIHGPAPEPLVRRVDDRGAARVERSRLSALGDGVQVQVGYLVGCYIRDLEDARVKAAA